MNNHFNITIRGKVQGVWYRASAQAAAKGLGLTGFVRNLPDGAVYAEAEGPQDVLQEFVNWCHHGPQLARVDEVLVEEAPLQGFESFEVQR